jgi:ABC-2 type transport system permease protein
MSHVAVFLSLTRAWMLGIVRDRATVFWMLAFPVLFVVIFGMAFGRNDVGTFNVGVVVDESTPTGQALLEGFRSVEVFKVSTGSLDDELAKLRDGDRAVVVTTAPADAASAQPAAASTVVVQFDPAEQTAQQIVLPIVRQVVNGVDQQLTGRTPVLTVEERSVRSDNLRYIDFFVPGIIAFSIMQAGMFAAIPLVQLRINRVLKRFGATPISRWAVLASQGATRLIISIVTTVVLLLVGKLLFDIHIGSNWLGMAAFVLLGGAAFLALGFFISGLSKTEEAVPALVQLVSFPMMFLGGVFFPIETFPRVVQVIARVLPLTFLADGLRQVMVGGAALYPLWIDCVVLLGWMLVGGVLALRVFKWE